MNTAGPSRSTIRVTTVKASAAESGEIDGRHPCRERVREGRADTFPTDGAGTQPVREEHRVVSVVARRVPVDGADVQAVDIDPASFHAIESTGAVCPSDLGRRVGSMHVPASDERRHEPGPDRRWHESFVFDFSSADGIGGSIRLDLRPPRRLAWFWGYVVVPEHGPVVVRDHEIPLGRPQAVSLRADGLWVDLVCETPMEHWSIGLEAFGVRLDEPGDAYRGEIGERMPVGFDLEWEAYTPEWQRSLDDAHAGHYEQVGEVHGEILLGSDQLEFEGRGERVHAWGAHERWVAGWHRASFQLGDGAAIAFERTDESGAATGFVWRAGDGLRVVEQALVETHLGPDDVPTAARYVLGDELEVDVEVLGAAPVPLDDVDGREARLARALCRYESTEGNGTGWSEWFQPGPLGP